MGARSSRDPPSRLRREVVGYRGWNYCDLVCLSLFEKLRIDVGNWQSSFRRTDTSTPLSVTAPL